jgi:hypothetical protein
MLSDISSVIAGNWHLLLPIGVVGALSWSVWLIRKILSARYRPLVNDFRDDDLGRRPVDPGGPRGLLERCLDTWLAQSPTEVIVILDVEDHEALARLSARTNPQLTVISFAHEGKRSPLGVGIRAATGEILGPCDADARGCFEGGMVRVTTCTASRR